MMYLVQFLYKIALKVACSNHGRGGIRNIKLAVQMGSRDIRGYMQCFVRQDDNIMLIQNM